MTGPFGVDNLYDRDTNPITLDEWAKLRGKGEEYSRIGETEIGGCLVSTIWMGMDLSDGSGLPLIFETMVFDKDLKTVDDLTARYTTKAQARAGHRLIVEKLTEAGGTA
jgi:hypothetical protein